MFYQTWLRFPVGNVSLKEMLFALIDSEPKEANNAAHEGSIEAAGCRVFLSRVFSSLRDTQQADVVDPQPLM